MRNEHDSRINSKRPAPRWNEKEIDFLFTAAEKKTPIEEVASALGRTEEGIKKKAAKLGIRFKSPKKRRPRIDWTDAEINTLRTLYAQGLSYREISQQIRTRTPDACSKRARIERLPLRRQDNVDRKQITDLYLQGHTIRSLSKQFGIPQAAIYRIADRDRKFKRTLTADEKRIIEERFLDGCTQVCISRRINRSQSIVSSYLTSQGFDATDRDIHSLIIDLKRNGFTPLQIAKKLEISAASVRLSLQAKGTGND